MGPYLQINPLSPYGKGKGSGKLPPIGQGGGGCAAPSHSRLEVLQEQLRSRLDWEREAKLTAIYRQQYQQSLRRLQATCLPTDHPGHPPCPRSRRGPGIDRAHPLRPIEPPATAMDGPAVDWHSLGPIWPGLALRPSPPKAPNDRGQSSTREPHESAAGGGQEQGCRAPAGQRLEQLARSESLIQQRLRVIEEELRHIQKQREEVEGSSEGERSEGERSWRSEKERSRKSEGQRSEWERSRRSEGERSQREKSDRSEGQRSEVERSRRSEGKWSGRSEGEKTRRSAGERSGRLEEERSRRLEERSRRSAGERSGRFEEEKSGRSAGERSGRSAGERSRRSEGERSRRSEGGRSRRSEGERSKRSEWERPQRERLEGERSDRRERTQREEREWTNRERVKREKEEWESERLDELERVKQRARESGRDSGEWESGKEEGRGEGAESCLSNPFASEPESEEHGLGGPEAESQEEQEAGNQDALEESRDWNGHYSPEEKAHCAHCGRRFVLDRLATHTEICKRVYKRTRKVYDSAQKRAKGTDLENYQCSHKVQPIPRGNWKRKHESFMRMLHAAQQAELVVYRCKKAAQAPPPPNGLSLDLRQCPHCSRRFPPTLALSHVPKCAILRGRPGPSFR
ncbi:uncharacterized protein LOC144597545 [Rhinoraja longicauda]